MKAIKRFYIDKPGSSYGTKPKSRWRIFRRKIRILESRCNVDGNGIRYTEYLMECKIPGHPTIRVGLINPRWTKSGVMRNSRMLK